MDHLDYQVHFYDIREGGFAHRPWLEFGYRSAPPKTTHASSSLTVQGFASASASGSTSRSASSTIVPKSGSRYTRGSTTNSLFARGYGDGTVLVWDYRNGAQKVRLLCYRPVRLLLSLSPRFARPRFVYALPPVEACSAAAGNTFPSPWLHSPHPRYRLPCLSASAAAVPLCVADRLLADPTPATLHRRSWSGSSSGGPPRLCTPSSQALT